MRKRLKVAIPVGVLVFGAALVEVFGPYRSDRAVPPGGEGAQVPGYPQSQSDREQIRPPAPSLESAAGTEAASDGQPLESGSGEMQSASIRGNVRSLEGPIAGARISLAGIAFLAGASPLVAGTDVAGTLRGPRAKRRFSAKVRPARRS